MKKIFLFLTLAFLVFSCTDEKEKTATTATGTETENAAAPVDLPYKAGYSSQFTTDVSDADLKTVLMSYKDWENGNMDGLAAVMADSVYYDGSDGTSRKLSKAELLKLWTSFRDSLAAVKVNMLAWHKMYAADKKQGHIVTWYNETDTYKDGKIDSAFYHDINRMENGKITWYSSMKRGFKK